MTKRGRVAKFYFSGLGPKLIIDEEKKGLLPRKSFSMITFVTGNKNKLAEVQALLGEHITNQNIDLDELQGSYEQIITHKLQAAAQVVKGPVMVEDTALEFDAFGKELPGPYIKWFLTELGPERLPRLLDGFENHQGSAVCTVGYCEGPNEPVHIFQGKTAGTIVNPRGPQTFGWDACFEPLGYSETYAEMEKVEKNKISHRGKAMADFRKFLESRQ